MSVRTHGPEPCVKVSRRLVEYVHVARKPRLTCGNTSGGLVPSREDSRRLVKFRDQFVTTWARPDLLTRPASGAGVGEAVGDGVTVAAVSSATISSVGARPTRQAVGRHGEHDRGPVLILRAPAQRPPGALWDAAAPHGRTADGVVVLIRAPGGVPMPAVQPRVVPANPGRRVNPRGGSGSPLSGR